MSGKLVKGQAIRRAVRGVFWGAFAAVSAAAAYQHLSSPEGQTRVADARQELVQLASAVGELRASANIRVAHAGKPGAMTEADKVAALESELDTVRGTSETLALDLKRSSDRIAALEEQLGSITGSIARQAATPPAGALSMFEPDLGSPQAGRFEIKPVGADSSANTNGSGLVTRTDFAVAVSTATEIGDIERAWNTLNRDYPNEFKGLKPFVSVERGENGPQLTLIAGPLRNAKDAAQICVALSVNGKLCRAVPMSGTVLALNVN